MTKDKIKAALDAFEKIEYATGLGGLKTSRTLLSGEKLIIPLDDVKTIRAVLQYAADLHEQKIKDADILIDHQFCAKRNGGILLCRKINYGKNGNFVRYSEIKTLTNDEIISILLDIIAIKCGVFDV